MEVFLAWGALLALVVLDRRGRRDPSSSPVDAGADPDRRTALLLAGLALFLAALRAPLAVARDVRNVDEYMYAASAAFFQATGEGPFGHAWNLSTQQLVWGLGSFAHPFAAVDVVTSLVVGTTGFLLGLLVLRSGGSRAAACLAVALYVLGILRFEGLTSNKEPYVNLFLAGYLFVRLGAPGTSVRRQLLAGLCLGAAMTVKEQAALFVFVEPALEGFDRWRAGGEGRLKTFLVHEALAALGFWIPLTLVLLGFLAQGTLGAYLAFLFEWATLGGAPLEATARAAGSIPPPSALAAPPGGPLGFFAGSAPLILSPVGLLGLVLLLRGDRSDRVRVGLSLTALVGWIAAAVGLRFFLHYFMLPLLALAPLAALRIAAAAEEVRQPERRAAATALLVVAALLTALEGGRLIATDAGRDVAQGRSESRAHTESLRAVGALLRARTPAEAPILVWGFQAELYFAAERRPATRYVGGVSARTRDALADLARFPPPAAVVFPNVRTPDGYDPFALEHHPELRAWLAANRYAPVNWPAEELRGYTVWTR